MNGNNRNSFFDDDSYYEPSRRPGNFQVHIDDSGLDNYYEDEEDYRSTAVRTREGDIYEVRKPTNRKKSKGNSRYTASSKDKGCISALVYAVAVCLISVFLSYWFIVGCNDMFALKKDETSVVVSVPQDASLSDVAKILEENGVIKYPFFFKLYANVTGDGEDFKHGDFMLTTKTDYSQIIRKLTNPASSDGSTVKVVFPEGMNVLQYAELLEENNVCTKDAFLNRVNSTIYNYWFLKDVYKKAGMIDENGKSTGQSSTSEKIYLLEGYLFPDTYEFYLNEGSESAVKKMLNNFNSKMTDEIQSAVSGSKYSLDQILTIASIVERETNDPEQMATVASVFYNRLKNSDSFPCLQSDATKSYPYATEADIPKNLANGFKSKYDTYTVKGLPAGAICNPSIDAIKAAASPEKTNYYFFFIDKNGKHYFSSTYSEHESVVKNCRANGLI